MTPLEHADCTAHPTDAHRWELLDVPPHPANVSHVRRQVRAVLTRWGAQDMEWVASQLLTEIVTNAVVHAGTPFDVVLTHAPDTVRCEVRDRHLRHPQARDASLEDITGRGMHLIARLATAWGVLPCPGGKTVWFELAPAHSKGDPGPDPDGDPDLDAPPFGPSPRRTVRQPDTDVACSTDLPCAGNNTCVADHRRIHAAA